MAGKSRRSKKSKKSPAAANARRNAAAMGKKARRSRSSARARSHERDLGNAAEYTFSGSGSAFGFAVPADGGEDLFIPPQLTMGAMHGDKVLVRRIREGERFFGKGNEGEVVEIVARGCTEVVGTLHRAGDMIYVAPDEKKIGAAVEVEDSVCDIADGDKVRVRIDAYPDEYRRRQYVRRRRFAGNDGTPEAVAAGCVIANYGSAETKDANYRAILDAAGIPQVFGDPVIAEAERAAEEVLLPNGRLDLRGDIIFTIDGAGAKDLDDAISLKPDGDGYILGVHIADVSHYVKANGEVDREAFSRGTSVYFVDKVVPMLPEVLSNGCCSLNAGEDKYALSAIMTLDADGEIVSAKFAKTIIRSAVRGVYSEVNNVLAHGEESEYFEKYSAVYSTLTLMEKLYRVLDARARKKGAMELDSREAEILLGEDGMPCEIRARERGTAERLIEQFMLRANVAAATFLRDHGVSGVYRIHEDPSPEKMGALAIFCHNMGLDVSGICSISDGAVAEPVHNVTPAKLSAVLDEAKEAGIGDIVSGVMLRSLMKAKYAPMPSPHFGLAEPLYCHFTSPIRRYPDLFVHRAISAVLEGGGSIPGSAEAAENATATEIRAVNAERAIEDLYMALYMRERIGEEFPAIITSVTGFGIFAETDELCEGLIPASTLGDDYTVNEAMYTATVRRDGQVHKFALGDRIKIRVTDASPALGKVTFAMV